MAEDSEDVSRNSGNNRRTQCGPDNDDQTPAVNAGLQTPAVNAGLQTPAVHATVNVNMSKQLETQLSAVSSHDSADDEVPSVENAHSLLVMTSCFLLVALAGGLAFSVGPLVVEWLDMFDLDPGTVGWITSINIGVMFLSGPIASILYKLYGFRPVLMAGSLVSSLGLLSSAFVDKYWGLYITYGVITGFGFGMANTLAFLVPGFYFDKHRVLAFGVTSAGMGAGTLLFPYLLRFLIRWGTWRGAMVYSSIISLQGVVFAALLFPPLPPKPPTVKTKELQNTLMPDDAHREVEPHGANAIINRRNSKEGEISETRRGSQTMGITKTRRESPGIVVLKARRESEEADISGTRSGSLGMNIMEPYRGSDGCQTKTRRESLGIGGTKTRRESLAEAQKARRAVRLFDMSLLVDTDFYLLFICHLLWNTGCTFPMVFLSDFAVENDLSKDVGATLVSVVGVSSLLSRLIVAVIGQCLHCSHIHLFNIGSLIRGVGTLLMPVAPSFWSLVVCSVLHGAGLGVQIGVLASLLAEVFGLHRLPIVGGYSVVSAALGAMAGTPIAGELYKIQESYDISFYLGGSITVISVIPLWIIWIRQRYKKSRVYDMKD